MVFCFHHSKQLFPDSSHRKGVSVKYLFTSFLIVSSSVSPSELSSLSSRKDKALICPDLPVALELVEEIAFDS